MTTNTKLKNRLKEILAENNITQSALAREMGVARQKICNLCINENLGVTVSFALQLSATLQIPIEQIFYLTEE